MIRFLIAGSFAALISFGAMAAQTSDGTCTLDGLPDGVPMTDEVDAAALQCDIEEAKALVDAADVIYNVSHDPLLRVVDTSSPSGVAYVYDILQLTNGLELVVRTVSDENSATRLPACQLRTRLDTFSADKLNTALFELSLTDVPQYARREQTFKNIDGSNRVVLLYDAKDIVTTVSMDGNTRHYSRHDKSDDAVTKVNERIIAIADRSSGWVCNAS